MIEDRRPHPGLLLLQLDLLLLGLLQLDHGWPTSPELRWVWLVRGGGIESTR